MLKKNKKEKDIFMEWALRFAYPFILYGLVPLFIGAVWYRMNYYKSPFYIYSATSILKQTNQTSYNYSKNILFFIRTVILFGLIFLIARPQLIDKKSHVIVDGIDIIMALDVSGSMNLFDDPNDQTQRITIAKEEAIKFVNNREDDPIGLVLFGAEAIFRCPLTLDKKMLTQLIKDTEIGIINADGTVISKGLITALAHFRKSQSKSKIIILLTDGEPSHNDVSPENVLFLAKKYGVKIYTIGIGGKYGGLAYDPFGNMRQQSMPLNPQLLKVLAKETGGQFFLAENQKELRTIYDTINKLETTEHETDIYHNYYDIFMPFLWCIAVLFILELCLITFVWFGL